MTNSDSPAKPKIKKRKYSRKGCNECKRRKIKCDEASPACNNCTRLNKTCIYESKSAFSDPSAPKSAHNADTPVKEMNLNLKFYKPKTPKSSKPEETVKKESPQRPVVSFQSSPDTSDHTFVKVDPLETPSLPTVTGLTPQAPPSMTSSVETNFEMQTVFNEASLLVSDIHHMLEDNVTNPTDPRQLAQFQPSPSLSDDKTQFSIEDFVDLNDRIDGSPHLPWNKRSEIWEFSNSQLIEECVSANNLGEPHSGYLRTLTSTELSYHMYPLASSIETNEVVKLLLMYSRECPHLLFSLLAISATFQFNQTGKMSHDIARQKYIGVCLRKLSDDFSEKPASRRAQSFHVEKLLMTVLVLTTYFSAKTSSVNDTVLNSWKVHLRGARDLLINYTRITKSSEMVSLGLALAKSWFFALEAVAAVFSSSANHRSLEASASDKDDIYGEFPNLAFDANNVFVDSGFFEYHENKFYHESLTKLAMVVTSPTSSDFHIFWGYTATLVKAIVCYTRVKEAMALKNLARAPMRWIAQIISLLGSAGREEIVPGVSPKDYHIPKTCRGNPEYEPVSSRYNFPPACYAVDTDENGDKTYYSWFDASNQFHVDFIHLSLLVSPGFYALPRTHYFVQEMVQRIFTGAFFIKKKSSPMYEKEEANIIVESDNYYVASPTFDNRCFMIQSAFRLCASIIVEEDYFEMIELFFMGLVKLGNGSSLYALDQVTRIKAIRQERMQENPDLVDEEVIDFEEGGKVSIPFA